MISAQGLEIEIQAAGATFAGVVLDDAQLDQLFKLAVTRDKNVRVTFKWARGGPLARPAAVMERAKTIGITNVVVEGAAGGGSANAGSAATAGSGSAAPKTGAAPNAGSGSAAPKTGSAAPNAGSGSAAPKTAPGTVRTGSGSALRP
jgi:hypothetical protein